MNVLLVEDDPRYADLFTKNLSDKFEITHFADPSQLFSNPQLVDKFDAVVLDLVMPMIDGASLFLQIKRNQLNPPAVFMLTSEKSESIKLKCLQLKIEDFLSKEMSWSEIHIRISNRVSKNRLTREGLSFDVTRNEISLMGQSIALTQVERTILLGLLNSENGSVNREQLVDSVWKGRTVVDHALSSHIYNLNQKLKEWSFCVRLEKSGSAVLASRVQ